MISSTAASYESGASMLQNKHFFQPIIFRNYSRSNTFWSTQRQYKMH